MKLGVNIDHIATLRNARGQDNPNLIRALKVCQEAKIDTLTVHLSCLLYTSELPTRS